jgi:hypothetical protein
VFLGSQSCLPVSSRKAPSAVAHIFRHTSELESEEEVNQDGAELATYHQSISINDIIPKIGARMRDCAPAGQTFKRHFGHMSFLVYSGGGSNGPLPYFVSPPPGSGPSPNSAPPPASQLPQLHRSVEEYERCDLLKNPHVAALYYNFIQANRIQNDLHKEVKELQSKVEAPEAGNTSLLELRR